MISNSDFLIVRADADSQIGTGHVMRVMALAAGWRRAGGQAVLITSASAELRKRAVGYFDHVLLIDHTNADRKDAENTLLLAEEHCGTPLSGNHWLVTDGYHFNPEYHQVLREADYPLLIIDDFAHLPHYHADVIINQNAGADQVVYRTAARTRLLLGSDYVMLRPEFSEAVHPSRHLRPHAQRLLITFGGVDAANMSIKVLDATRNLKQDLLQVRVIVGPSNPHVEEIQQFCAREGSRYRVLRNVENMHEQLQWTDVAISAAGTTTWELAHMGVPALLISVAGNQRSLAGNIHRLGAARHLGWYSDISTAKIHDALEAMLNSRKLRSRISRRGREMIDGKGVERIVKEMASLHAVA